MIQQIRIFPRIWNMWDGLDRVTNTSKLVDTYIGLITEDLQDEGAMAFLNNKSWSMSLIVKPWNEFDLNENDHIHVV